MENGKNGNFKIWKTIRMDLFEVISFLFKKQIFNSNNKWFLQNRVSGKLLKQRIFRSNIWILFEHNRFLDHHKLIWFNILLCNINYLVIDVYFLNFITFILSKYALISDVLVMTEKLLPFKMANSISEVCCIFFIYFLELICVDLHLESHHKRRDLFKLFSLE